MIKISSSVASIPKEDLVQTIKKLTLMGLDAVHLDIEDGRFVPSLSIDIDIIQELRPLTQLPFDVHLSACDPEKLIPHVASMGADWITVHLEACPYPHRTLSLIREYDKRAGLAINPITPLPDIQYLHHVLDFISVLTTEPEYPNALFLPEILEKVRQGRQKFSGLPIDWMVDGGITEENLPKAIDAGATIVVIGRSLFQHGTVDDNWQKIRNITQDIHNDK